MHIQKSGERWHLGRSLYVFLRVPKVSPQQACVGLHRNYNDEPSNLGGRGCFLKWVKHNNVGLDLHKYMCWKYSTRNDLIRSLDLRVPSTPVCAPTDINRKSVTTSFRKLHRDLGKKIRKLLTNFLDEQFPAKKVNRTRQVGWSITTSSICSVYNHNHLLAFLESVLELDAEVYEVKAIWLLSPHLCWNKRRQTHTPGGGEQKPSPARPMPADHHWLQSEVAFCFKGWTRAPSP